MPNNQKLKITSSSIRKKNDPIVNSIRSNGIVSKSFERPSDDPLNRNSPSFIYYMSKLKIYSMNAFTSKSYFGQLYREHFYQSFQTLNLFGNLRVTNSEAVLKNKVFLSRRPTHKGNLITL